MPLNPPKWWCNQTDWKRPCTKEAKYHRCVDGKHHQYYCQEHWNIRLGFAKKKNRRKK